jgi:hypothetical protein
MKTQTPLRYQHRVVTVGSDWYIEAEVLNLASHTKPADLLPILHVKHGWKLDRIAITGIDSPPYIAGGVGPKLRQAHEAAQQGDFRDDIKVIVPWSPGELWGDEPLARK